MLQETHHGYKSDCTTITGIRNREKGKANEDVVFIDETSDLMFYGLADGQSGKSHCREGGLETLKAVFQYLLQEGIDRLIDREHIDEIQYEVIRLIRKAIGELATKEKIEKAEFASTLVVFAYDSQTTNFIVIHLGDGGIIGERTENEELIIISPPENGISSQYTWLTTSDSVLSHLRISFGKTDTYSRIVLFTDGAKEICHGKNISTSAKQLISKSRNPKGIFDYMQENYHADDASCIVVDFSKTAQIQ